MRPFQLLCIYPAMLGVALAQQRVTETIYPADAPVSDGDAIWQSCRVVDAITGKPIHGAELLLVEERPTPLAGEFWAKRTATSDADGFVRVRSDDLKGEWDMLLLRAPGYGASAVQGVVPSLVWPLSPGIDLPIVMRDWQERPIAKARLGFCLGCGHTPDIANATTDAEGRAVLHGIDPNNEIADLYPEGPGLGIAEYARVEWAPGDLPAILRVAPGASVRGKVLDVDGKPMADVYVGAPQAHRGPWAKTSADGTFALEGAAPNADLTVMVGKQEVRFERPDLDQPFTLQLPKLPDPKDAKAQGDDERDDPRRPQMRDRQRRPPQALLVELSPLPEAGRVAVALEITGANGKGIDQLEISTVGPLPHHRSVEEETHSGVANFDRLPGKYEVVCRSPGYESKIGTFEVVAGKPCKAKLAATPLALLQVRAENFAQLGSISLRTEFESREITAEFDAAGTATVAVPNQAPFCFVVGNESGVHVQRTNFAEAKPAQPFVLRGITPTQITGIVVGPDDQPIAADIAIVGRVEYLRAENGFDPLQANLAPFDDGKFTLQDTHTGLAFVVIVPRSNSLRPTIHPVTLPRRGTDAKLELGKLKVASQPQVTVLGAGGEPEAGVLVGVTRIGWGNVRERGPAFPTDQKGGLLAPELHEGDAVVVPASTWDIEHEGDEDHPLTIDLPYRTVLAGAGPWQIQAPAGELEVELKDKAGQPVTGRIFLADRSVLVPSKVHLRQVPPGKHELIVTAINHKTMLVSVDVPAQGSTSLLVELPER